MSTVLATVVDDNMVPGYLTLLCSLQRYQLGYRQHVAICPCGSKAAEVLRAVDTVVEYDPSRYAAMPTGIRRPNMQAAYAKWEALKLFDDERVKRLIVIDADMLCVDDPSLLLSDRLDAHDIWVCRDAFRTPRELVAVDAMNTGLVVFNRSLMDRKPTFASLLYSYADAGMHCEQWDQSVMHRVVRYELQPATYGWLPPRFNVLKLARWNGPMWAQQCLDPVFLHFVGSKPWDEPSPGLRAARLTHGCKGCREQRKYTHPELMAQWAAEYIKARQAWPEVLC